MTKRQPLFQRVELLIGEEAMARVSAASVILFGVGGVGGWAAEALVRTGVRRLTMVDPDAVCVTNVNRQVQATAGNVGQPKVDELRKRLLEINPEAEIAAVKALFCRENLGLFDFGRYDYVLDAIDSLPHKILLLRVCFENGHKIFSSMGAAAKIDPAGVRTAPLSKTNHCPLARVVRRGLRRQNVLGDCLCVYSEEPPAENKGRSRVSDVHPLADGADPRVAKTRPNGSLVHVTAPFGFALAGLVVRDLAMAAPENNP